MTNFFNPASVKGFFDSRENHILIIVNPQQLVRSPHNRTLTNPTSLRVIFHSILKNNGNHG